MASSTRLAPIATRRSRRSGDGSQGCRRVAAVWLILLLDRKLTAKATEVAAREERAMTKPMGRVICDMTISADGYSAGLNQSEERPFGDAAATAGATSCWRRRCRDPGRRDLQPVPRRRPDRRSTAAHCAAPARRRHAAVRGRPAAETRAGEVAGSETGHARDLPRAVLSWRAVLHDYRGLQHRGSRP
jgi:hypothetical protein